MADETSARALLAAVRERFADASNRLERVIAVLGPEELAFRANAASNSAGNLVLHLCGHLDAAFLGEAARRDRAGEFLAEGPFDGAKLRARTRTTFDALDRYLAGLDGDSLLEPKETPAGTTLLAALVYSLAHTTEHVGQVILLAKAERPDATPALWGTPVRQGKRPSP